MANKRGRSNKLTVKQEAFVRKYTDRGNKETYLKQGASFRAVTGTPYETVYGKTGGYEMMRKPHVKAAIIEALHRQKITPEYQAKKMKELMESTRKVYHEGIAIDEVPDNEVRHKALVTSLKVTEAIDKLESATNGVEVKIAPELAERLVRIAAEMRAMREEHSGRVIPLIPINGKVTDNG